MRTAVGVTLTILLMTAPADAQSTRDLSHERLSIGGSVAPALPGCDGWLLHGVRVGAPLSPRTAIDVEAGWIEGVNTAYGDFRHFVTVQLRRLRAPRTQLGESSYWIYGLQYLPEHERDQDGRPRGRKTHVNGVFGYGADNLLTNGVRVSGEVGVSAGDGLLLFAKIAIGWSRLRDRAGR